MKKFNTREKLLSFSVFVLLAVIIYLAYNLHSLGFFTTQRNVSPDFNPPTFEDSIKSSRIIFTCITENEGNHIRFKIDRILYKRDNVEFPYHIGEIYGDMSEKKRPNMDYADGRLVFLCDGPIVMRSLPIRNGEVKPYREKNSHKVLSIKEISELIKSYKNDR